MEVEEEIKSKKSETKEEEYEVEFIMKSKKSKQKFNTSQEIYLLYVYCSKVFQCGLISLYYNGINLNFIDKNTKISKIFKKGIKNPKIKVLAKDNLILKRKNNEEVNINQNYNLPNITIDKGTISQNLNNIQNNEVIDKIILTEEKIDESEIIPCFFSQIANKIINKLAINPKFLLLIDSMDSCQNLNCFNELKELEIIAPKKSVNLIKTIEFEFKNIIFPKLKRLKLSNITIKFNNKINFNNLEKLELFNSYIIFSDNKSENNASPQIIFNSLSYLGLNYIYYTDLCQQLDLIMKKTKTVDILKLKLNSIEFDKPFNFTEFCTSNQKNIEKVKNIELNLKTKFIFEEINTKEQKKCVDKFLRKTTKLKLLPFSKFTEKELEYFGSKLSNINLLQLQMLNIENENELVKFLQFYPDLEYISLDEKYNFLIPSKIYKLNIHSIDDIIKNKEQFKTFINNLKVDKLEKIEIPFFEFDRETKNLKILGDLLPMKDTQQKKENNNDDIETNEISENDENNLKLTDLEEIFILLKKILFNIPYIDKLILQNFETENKAIFLNNFLIGFMNLLSSPKINKLKLIDVYIDKGLVDKFSFMFMNSSSCLKSLELNNIKIEQDDMQFLFYTLLFQIEYKKLSTLKLCNLDINQTFLQVTEDYNIFKKVDNIYLDSLNNFELIKNIILNLDTNTGISFKNLKISEEELTKYLTDNGDYLRKLELDLEGIKLYEVLKKDEISFKDLRCLKVYESFDNFEDISKFQFFENKWLQMKKLRKLYVYIKTNSNSNRSKERELLSLFKYIKNII